MLSQSMYRARQKYSSILNLFLTYMQALALALSLFCNCVCLFICYFFVPRKKVYIIFMEGVRQTIVTLHNAGRSNSEIFDVLKNNGIGMRLIQRTVKRFKETGALLTDIESGPKACNNACCHQEDLKPSVAQSSAVLKKNGCGVATTTRRRVVNKI